MRVGWLVAIIALFVWSVASAAPLGQSLVPLKGPWKFQTGDSPRWSAPTFDDSHWQTVDLTPAPDAHDSDVGLKNYVPGWSARGHRGYVGYAWYRLNVRVADPGSDALWLVAPADVDNAYQLVVNGHLVGGIGDFARSPPTVFAIQPRLFKLPRSLWTVKDGQWSGVIAIRVVLERGSLLRSQADAGGVHIAPLLGTEEAASNHYHIQWLQMIEGYTVDAVEPLVFLLLAIMALSLMPFDPKERFYPWLATALALLAAARANQPIYFLLQIETMHAFAFWRLVVIDALTFAAWTMGWRAAFSPRAQWIAWASGGLAAVYAIARLLTLSMFFPDVPHAVVSVLTTILPITRLGFLGVMLSLVIHGVRRPPPAIWLALASFVCIAVGLFATELGEIGVPGIWFPFGVGVSRTEYAYALFDVVMFAYLLQRLWAYSAARRVMT